MKWEDFIDNVDWTLEIQGLQRTDIECPECGMKTEATWILIRGVFTPGGDPYYECSNCGYGRCYGIEHGGAPADECPNCGAKMMEIEE